jgi:hypothetical protein
MIEAMKTLVLISACFLIACTGAHKQAPDPVTTAHLILNHDEIDSLWRSVHKEVPNYPYAERERRRFACINIGYIIGQDGIPHNPVVIASYPENTKAFKTASMHALKSFKYEATAENPKKMTVFTSYKFIFKMEVASYVTEEQEKRATAELGKSCAVDVKTLFPDTH